jgi:hypothetical protein
MRLTSSSDGRAYRDSRRKAWSVQQTWFRLCQQVMYGSWSPEMNGESKLQVVYSFIMGTTQLEVDDVVTLPDVGHARPEEVQPGQAGDLLER